MRKLSLLGVVLFTLFSFFTLPTVAYAQSCDVGYVATDFGCWPGNPIGFVQEFYSVGLAFVAGIAILALIAGGYTIMTSQGNPERVNVGKSWIFYAIVGLLLAIFGYVFIEVVVVDVLKVPGFS